MLLDAAAVGDWAAALQGIDTLLVRLTAPLDVLTARDRSRPHGRVPGLAAGHKALHDDIGADLVIDTAATSPTEAAALVFAAQAAPGRVLSRSAGAPGSA